MLLVVIAMLCDTEVKCCQNADTYTLTSRTLKLRRSCFLGKMDVCHSKEKKNLFLEATEGNKTNENPKSMLCSVFNNPFCELVL